MSNKGFRIEDLVPRIHINDDRNSMKFNLHRIMFIVIEYRVSDFSLIIRAILLYNTWLH